MRPFTTGSDYVNQIGLETDEGSERIKAAYGANYDRLTAVKNKYDPTNLFRHNQNIKPTVIAVRGRPKYATLSFFSSCSISSPRHWQGFAGIGFIHQIESYTEALSVISELLWHHLRQSENNQYG